MPQDYHKNWEIESISSMLSANWGEKRSTENPISSFSYPEMHHQIHSYLGQQNSYIGFGIAQIKLLSGWAYTKFLPTSQPEFRKLFASLSRRSGHCSHDRRFLKEGLCSIYRLTENSLGDCWSTRFINFEHSKNPGNELWIFYICFKRSIRSGNRWVGCKNRFL